MPSRQHKNMLRQQTARLTCRLLAPLLDSGLVTAEEYSLIKRNLDALAKTGEPAPEIPARLITPQEAAEMLAISYSQFRALEKEGAFPFKRRSVGEKTVRYYLPDVVKYMQLEDVHEKA